MSSSDSTAVPPAAPVRRSFRQKLVRKSRAALQDGSAAALASARGVPAAIGRCSTAMLHWLAGADPARALGLVRRAQRLRPGSAFLAQARAILTARTHGWTAAAPLFAAPAATRMPGAAVSLLRDRPAPAAALALPARERPTHLDPVAAAALVVYTTAFGDEPDPAPVFVPIPGLRFVCLTDRPLDVAGWEALPPAAGAPGPDVDPRRTAAWCRIRPDLALAKAAPAARASLYLGPDRWLVGNLNTLLLRWCLPHDLALWRHPHGINSQNMAEHALVTGISGGSLGHRPGRGLRRRRAAARPRRLGHRDDLAPPPRPGGDGADGGLVARRRKPPASRRWRSMLRSTAPPCPLHSRASCRRRSGRRRTTPSSRRARRRRGRAGRHPGAAPGRWPWFMPREYAGSASTYLRGRQLAEMVAARDPDLADTRYTSDLASLRDRVVVLTKGALEVHPAEAIDDLARRNIAVIGSWDDMLPEADKVAATQGSMTLSHRQTTDFARLFPDRPAFHVTHHVNAQIRPSTPPMDRPRTGYFGFLRNTHCPASLRGMIDLVGIETAKVEMNWLDALPDYNCHWIVRRRGKTHDGWKPFLKGFVAARCNAVVITGRDDDDALQYLGDDYPFYVRGTDAGTLRVRHDAHRRCFRRPRLGLRAGDHGAGGGALSRRGGGGGVPRHGPRAGGLRADRSGLRRRANNRRSPALIFANASFVN